jgi:hypothetical protein
MNAIIKKMDELKFDKFSRGREGRALLLAARIGRGRVRVNPSKQA